MKKTNVKFKIDFKIGLISKTYFIEKSSFVLGRSENSEIKIDDLNVSREQLKVFIDDSHGLCIQDLGSANGSFLNHQKITNLTVVQIKENDLIAFGKSKVSFKIGLFSVDQKIQKFTDQLQEQIKTSDVKVEISGYPKNDDEIELNFKNIGVNVPKYKDANEHSVEIIREAEYIRHSILTHTEAQKQKTLNAARIESKRIADETYQMYLNNANKVLTDLKLNMQKLQTDTNIELDQKRLEAQKEIKSEWDKYESDLEQDKKIIRENLSKENELKLSIQLEQQKNDLFIEKDKILRQAQSEIEARSQQQKTQIELDENAHTEKMRHLNLSITELESHILKLENSHAELTVLKSESESQIDVLSSQISDLTAQHESIQKKFELLNSEYVEKSEVIESYRKAKTDLINETTQLKQEIENLSLAKVQSSEKKNQIEANLQALSNELSQVKIKNKAQIEFEFLNLKKLEQEKFEAFKSNELKDLQKIREQHSESIKKLSIDLAQEITTTLELQSKKNDVFNFEKNFEVVHSIIQVKSSAITGSTSKHQLQLDNWKKRQHAEKTKLILTGFVSAFAVYFSFNFLSAKFSQDSRQMELREIASARQKKEIENKYLPEMTEQYFDNYVQSTIYTKRFSEVYLDVEIQNEWVKHATVYFLNKWKVPEENTIKVISNSKALVQAIVEEIPNLKKDHLKNDIEKLNLVEKINVDEQAKILGTYVKYEAYKKLEKSFFSKKIENKK